MELLPSGTSPATVAASGSPNCPSRRPSRWWGTPARRTRRVLEVGGSIMLEPTGPARILEPGSLLRRS